ncbi:MAG: hypothetical protein K9L78_02705 [Victivallales bacterium]|nr:hypothetical protein [Victivallales bacterium]
MENYKDFIKNYLRNFLFTFRAYEIPNNVNYYFIRKFLFPVSFMPGPIILFPFALAGLLFIFIYRKKYNNTVLLLLFILPVAAACTFFVPIARYRIVLIPVMAVGAGILLKNLLCFLFDRKYIKLFFASITVAIFALLQYMSMENNYYRASDYVAYGQAMRWQNSKNPLILPLFKKAFTIRPDLKFTKKNLIIECLRNGNFNSAKQLLQPEYKKNPRNFDTAINYASSLLGCKKFNKAYEVLSNIEKTDSPERKKKLYFNLGEYYFLTGRYNKAKNCYTVLLNLTDSQNIHAREVAEKRLLLIKQNIMEK